MDKKVVEGLIKAFISEKLSGEISSENVHLIMIRLHQLGVWDEGKDILRKIILERSGFIEDPEFINGKVSRKRGR